MSAAEVREIDARYWLTEKGTAITDPWQPGQTSRYLACGTHAAPLDRMPYDDAFDRAALCGQAGGDCITQVRPS